MQEFKEASLSTEEEMLRILKDPVLWAKHHLDNPPRWYQEQILRHPHNRKVLRCGRRIGKCIEENQRILLDNGEYIPIKEMYQRQHEEEFLVPALGKSLKQEKHRIESVEYNGEKDVYEVQTKRGNTIILTKNHPLLTIDGWVEVQDIVVGDYVATPKALPSFGTNDERSNEFVELLAYLLTSCTTGHNILTVELKSEKSIAEFKRICTAQGLQLIPKSAKYFFIVDPSGKNEAIRLAKEAQKRVPKEVFTYTKEKLARFLSAVYDSQGWSFAGKIPELGFGSRDNDFLTDLSHLLLRFNIRPSKVKRMVRDKPYIQMMVFRFSDLREFMDQIAIYSWKDYSELKEVLKETRDDSLLVPIGKLFKEEVKDKKIKLNKKPGARMSERKLEFLGKKYHSVVLNQQANSDVFYDKVVAIQPIGKRPTYDIFVPENGNLVVEDFYVHNTWTMIAHMLWVAFTCNGGECPNGATCVVATPYDNQARLIFDELVKSIERNEVLRQSIKTKTKNPYYIEFLNGSAIKLFTAGTKSGAEGGSLRGQRADWLYMDKIFVPLWRELH